MRISDEKRREIAASLRESREFISGLPKASLEQNAFDTFDRILACVDYERGNIFDYLADLIDRPTCELVEVWDGEAKQHYLDCTACHFGRLAIGLDDAGVRFNSRELNVEYDDLTCEDLMKARECIDQALRSMGK